MQCSSMSTFLPEFQPLERHGTHAGVGQLAGRQRPLGAQQLEDVVAAGGVGLDPVGGVLLPLAQRRAARPVAHVGAEQGHVVGGAQHAVVLDDGAVDDQGVEVVGAVGAAEPAPQHEVGAGGHGRGEVDLHHPQPAHDLEQVGGARGVEQLGPHRDAAGLLPGQLVHHAPSSQRRARRQSGSPAKTNLR